MFIPLRTDAPVYHRPWATGGIIAANVAVHVWVQVADPASVRPFLLQYGQWAPWQWLTSVFLHAGWFHLLGNMLFLWVFGLVVEGKIGWKRFLVLYGAIAVAANLVEQTLMLGSDGASLGASGVIFGLIAIAMVWAPENEVECILVFFPVVRDVNVSIRTLGILYLAKEVLSAMLSGFGMSSAVLHLLGAAAGLPIGIAMVKRGWVNCEGWDWFSRRDHRPVPIGAASRVQRTPTPLRSGAPATPPARAAAVAPRPASEPVSPRFAALVRDGDVEGALLLHSACSSPERSTLDASDRERLIGKLVDADRPADARPVISGVLDDDPGHPRIGLLEAGLLVRERRPSKAGQTLAAIAGRLEDEPQRAAHADLVAQTEALRAAGVLELDD